MQAVYYRFHRAGKQDENTFSWPSLLIIEWFSKRTGMSFQNGARSKNVDKKLGRERRRVVLKSDLAVVATRILTSAF